jgi:hypothetical protein
MQENSTIEKQVSTWLNSNRNYTEGVLLFQKYGKNLTMKKLFPGREKRYKDKLAYELGKIIGFTLTKRIPLVQTIEVKDPVPELAEDMGPLPGKPPMTEDSVPKIIAAIVIKMQELYQKRSVLHGKMKLIAADNRPENVLERKEFSDSMALLSDELDHLAIFKNQYDESGNIPEIQQVFGKPSPGKPAEVDFEMAEKQRLNLQKSIARDRILLDYQSKTKLREQNPMPNGPKRVLVEKRVKEKLAAIKELDKILANDPR